ncbi:unnamed protein product [Sphagnum tenellum]
MDPASSDGAESRMEVEQDSSHEPSPPSNSGGKVKRSRKVKENSLYGKTDSETLEGLIKARGDAFYHYIRYNGKGVQAAELVERAEAVLNYPGYTPSIEDKIFAAESYSRIGNNVRAAELVESALSQPGSTPGHLARASQIQTQAGNYARAAELKRSMLSHPEFTPNASDKLEVARAYLEAGNMAKASEFAESALSHPGYIPPPKALRLASQIQYEAGNYARAAQLSISLLKHPYYSYDNAKEAVEDRALAAEAVRRAKIAATAHFKAEIEKAKESEVTRSGKLAYESKAKEESLLGQALKEHGVESTECPICLEEHELGSELSKACEQCKLGYHPKCIGTYCAGKGDKISCPGCREPLDPARIVDIKKIKTKEAFETKKEAENSEESAPGGKMIEKRLKKSRKAPY